MAQHRLPPDLPLGGGAGLHGDEVVQFARALGEAQRLSTTTVAGAAANTGIAVTGLAADDTLQSVIEYDTGVPADRTADSIINSDGELEVDADTTGNVLVVSYWDHTA